MYISGIIITKHIVIIVITDTGGEDDFPLGLVVGVSVAGVVIIATPIGAIIIVVIVVVRHKRKKKEKNEVIYEEPDIKIETDIPLSDNQAYGHVNMQRMRN